MTGFFPRPWTPRGRRAVDICRGSHRKERRRAGTGRPLSRPGRVAVGGGSSHSALPTSRGLQLPQMSPRGKKSLRRRVCEEPPKYGQPRRDHPRRTRPPQRGAVSARVPGRESLAFGHDALRPGGRGLQASGPFTAWKVSPSTGQGGARPAGLRFESQPAKRNDMKSHSAETD